MFSVPYRIRIEGRTCPITQTPVFIVDEYATISYRGTLERREIVRESKQRLTLRYYVAPPHPRRYSCHATEFKDSISTTTTIISGNDYLPVAYSKPEGVKTVFHFVGWYTLTTHTRYYGTVLIKLNNLDSRILSGYSTLSRHLLHIGSKHIEGNGEYGSTLAFHAISNRMGTVEPTHFSIYDRNKRCQYGIKEK